MTYWPVGSEDGDDVQALFEIDDGDDGARPDAVPDLMVALEHSLAEPKKRRQKSKAGSR